MNYPLPPHKRRYPHCRQLRLPSKFVGHKCHECRKAVCRHCHSDHHVPTGTCGYNALVLPS